MKTNENLLLNLGGLFDYEVIENKKKLFVGIDIGKNYNFASIVIGENANKIIKKMKFKNNVYEFNNLLIAIEEIMEIGKLSKEEVLIGVESTGHYWENINHFFKIRNYDMGMTKNNLVKLKRKVKYRNKGKNDVIDSHCIALVLIDGDYIIVEDRDSLSISLKRLTRTKEKFVKVTVNVRNTLRSLLDIYNPTYLEVFTDPFCKTGRAILREFLSPRDIIDKNIKEIKDILIKNEKNKGIQYRLIGEYLFHAKEIYKDIKDIKKGQRAEIKYYLECLEYLEEKIQDMDETIKEIAEEVELNHKEIAEIKGVGEMETIRLLSEIGDITRFKTTRELQAYLGLTITEESSGGDVLIKPKANKAGNRRARSILIYMAMNVVDKNPDWKKVYC